MCRGSSANLKALQVAGPTLLTSRVSDIKEKEHTSCQWCRYTALSGAARARRGANGRRARDRVLAMRAAEETSVGFTDEDGDSLVFSRNAGGSLDYYANGVLRVRDLTHLRTSGVADGLEIHIAGQAAGPWASSWSSAVPAMQADVAERAVALFEDARRDVLSAPFADDSATNQLCRCHLTAAEATCGASSKDADPASFGNSCWSWLTPYCQWCAAL